MSRYCGEVNSAPILRAAEHWRDVALLEDGSVLSDKPLWTQAGIAALNTYFVGNPDPNGRNSSRSSVNSSPPRDRRSNNWPRK